MFAVSAIRFIPVSKKRQIPVDVSTDSISVSAVVALANAPGGHGPPYAFSFIP